MRVIKVGYDNQIFVLQKFGGISRYFIELFEQFDKNQNVNWNIIGTISRNEYLSDKYKVLVRSHLNHWNFKGSIRLIKMLNKLSWYLNTLTSQLKPDIYHLTYYDTFFFGRLNKHVPKVITVYDMIHEIFGGDLATMNSKRRVVNNCDLVIAISQSTANDIQRYYDIAKEKIVVIHLASSLRPVNHPSNLKLPGKYILYVGLRDWYKNFIGFIEAVHPILIEDKGLVIICAGGPKFTTNELDIFNRYGILQQILWKPIEGDEQLASYYQNALFFIFPSKYEGFGIPVLEAMNCDCPVALSDTSSLREVASNAGHYFNPNSIDSIRNTCLELIDSESLRSELIEKGRVRRNEFSWQKTAEETLRAYDSLLNS